MEIVKFTDISGIKVGHEQNLEAGTGCTVIICEEGAHAGVDVRGGSPGTRETDLLNPVNLVEQVHAVMLAGGSAFGLDAASGIMQYLEERGVGFDVGFTKVPIVSGAILFDLACGDYRVRPDKEMGYKACLNSNSLECPEGTVGAGTGATVGKFLGMEYAMKGGLGTYCFKTGDLMVGAIVAVNCLGDVVDSRNGKILAGTLSEDKMSFANTEELMIKQYDSKKKLFSGNTTIGVVATNAQLNKAQANKVASMAHNGYGRTIRPAHSMFDGDTVFAMATGKVEADINVVGMLAARAVEHAVIRAVKTATPLHGFKTCSEMVSNQNR
jgi:L-aminopeptidase/D-esterase-like protein